MNKLFIDQIIGHSILLKKNPKYLKGDEFNLIESFDFHYS